MKVYIVELSDDPDNSGTRRVELPKGPMSIEFDLGDRRVISVSLCEEDDGKRGLEVRCVDGRLVIRPNVSNEVMLDVERR